VCDGYEIRLLSKLPECACGCIDKHEPPEQCCSETPTKTTEQTADAERLQKRQKPWEECDEEEKDGRFQEMKNGARRCDRDHRLGVCNCACCCDCVVLARLLCCEERDQKREYRVDHTVRRFIRPVLSYDYMAYGVGE
jgi:hypothetical protein